MLYDWKKIPLFTFSIISIWKIAISKRNFFASIKKSFLAPPCCSDYKCMNVLLGNQQLLVAIKPSHPGELLPHKNIKVRDRREFIKLSIMSPVFYSILVQLTAVSVDGIEHSGFVVNIIILAYRSHCTRNYNHKIIFNTLDLGILNSDSSLLYKFSVEIMITMVNF